MQSDGGHGDFSWKSSTLLCSAIWLSCRKISFAFCANLMAFYLRLFKFNAKDLLWMRTRAGETDNKRGPEREREGEWDSHASFPPDWHDDTCFIQISIGTVGSGGRLGACEGGTQVLKLGNYSGFSTIFHVRIIQLLPKQRKAKKI